MPGRRAIRIGHGREGRRSALALHHRLRRRARLEPEGAVSLSCGPAALRLELPRLPRQSAGEIAAEGGQALAALEGLGFAVDWFDRGSYRREDPLEVARMRGRDDARALLIARDMPVLRNAENGLDSLLPVSEIQALGG